LYRHQVGCELPEECVQVGTMDSELLVMISDVPDSLYCAVTMVSTIVAL
jgi:hypothetical protein